MQVVTIGNFDGVHKGHQAIAARAAAHAGSSGRATAITFEPLPASVLRPLHAPARLTTTARRAQLLRDAGCTDVVELHPTIDLLNLEPEAFIADLRTRVPFDAIVEGADFRFGHRRAGTVETLKVLGTRMGFTIIVAPEVEVALADSAIVAPRSTTIRWMLELGRVNDAARLLGRAHAVEGAVVRGDQRGRTLGFPTANVQCAGQQLPADGVYAGTAHTPIGSFRAAISVGTKPTFANAARACEAHLLEFHGALDEYGWPIRVDFSAWIREQWRFSGADALVEQMRRDVAQCA